MTPERMRRIKRNILGLRIFTGNNCRNIPAISVRTAPPTSQLQFELPQRGNLHKQELSPRCFPSPKSAHLNPNGSPRSPYRGDRFIPCRSTTNFEHSHHRLSPSRDKLASPVPERLKKLSLFKEYHENSKILKFGTSSPKSVEERSPSKSPRKRNLSTSCQRILDAPKIINNFFMTALNWSSENRLAAALDNEVYVYNVDTGETLSAVPDEEEDPFAEITAVLWNKNGSLLAVGNGSGKVHVYDKELKHVLVFNNHQGFYVTTLAWKGDLILSGDTSGQIVYQSVLSGLPLSIRVNVHSNEIICGLSWSYDETILASGDSSGLVVLWKDKDLSRPYRQISCHKSAVKALRWCPWRKILATGGGVLDHHLSLWKSESSTPVASVDTQSQICDLVWSEAYQEIATCHAGPEYAISFWGYPNLEYKAKILGHEDRVLTVSLSPRKTHLASASADETIRLWKCFPEKKHVENIKSPLNMFNFR